MDFLETLTRESIEPNRKPQGFTITKCAQAPLLLHTPSSVLTSVDNTFQIIQLHGNRKKIERSTVKLSEPRAVFLIKEVFRFYWIL